MIANNFNIFKKIKFFIGSNQSKLLDYITCLISCIFCLAFFYRNHLFNGELKFTMDFTDPLIQAARLEHWRGVFKGNYNWLNPIYFYPNTNVLGYNDSYFQYGLIYSLLRNYGFNQLISLELTCLAFRILGYVSTWILLRKYFHTKVFSAFVGSFLITLSNGIYIGTQHTQLETIALIPILFILFAEIYKTIQGDSLKNTLLISSCVSILIATWLMTAFYTIFLTSIYLLSTSLIYAVLYPTSARMIFADLFGDQKWKTFIIPFIILIAGLIPFLITYIPIAKATGMHPLTSMLIFAPTWQNLFSYDAGNIFWGHLHKYIYSGSSDPIQNIEPTFMITIFEFVIVLLSPPILWVYSRSNNNFLDTKIIMAFSASIIFGLVLILKVNGWALWALVFDYVPGARAIRVVYRYELVLLVIAALVTAFIIDLLLKNGKFVSAFAIIFASIIMIEQLNFTSIASLTMSEVSAAVDPIVSPPATCKAFYAKNPPTRKDLTEIQKSYYSHSPQAMLIAESVGIPTVNGMDTFLPRGYNLINPDALDYDARAYIYAFNRNILDGFCSFDLTNKSWTLVDTPPATDHVNPIGSGVINGDKVYFGVGQSGLGLLTDNWALPEHWGSWSIEHESFLLIKFNKDAFYPDGANVAITMGTYLPLGISKKRVQILQEIDPEKRITLSVFDQTSDQQTHEFCIPAEYLTYTTPMKLVLSSDLSFSPSMYDGASDTRLLNISLISMSFQRMACKANVFP